MAEFHTFVVDDLASVNPWTPREIEVRGDVEVLGSGGEDVERGFDRELCRIWPRRIVSWGLSASAFFECRAQRSLGWEATDELTQAYVYTRTGAAHAQ